MNEKLKLFVRISAAVLLVTLMVFLSELIDEKEILFPEAAALALGGLAAEHMPWRVTPVRMAVLMSAGGFAGYFLSAFMPGPLWVKIILAFIFCCIMLWLSETTMLPMISAAVLPVITHAESLMYPLSVIIITATVLLIRYILISTGMRQDDEECSCRRGAFIPFALHYGYLCIVLMIISAIAIGTGKVFIIAPPLIVAFAELSEKESPARRSPVLIFLCVTMCALTGTISRLLICQAEGYHAAVGAFFAAVLSMALLMRFGKPFPPAAALAILPFILPESELTAYPFEAAAGMALFTLTILLPARVRKLSNQRRRAAGVSSRNRSLRSLCTHKETS